MSTADWVIWTNRLEKEGLLDMDAHYRAVSNGKRPADVREAMRWQQEARKRSA